MQRHLKSICCLLTGLCFSLLMRGAAPDTLENRPAHVPDSLIGKGKIVALHDSVGMLIDSTEKTNCRLFPFWHRDKFAGACLVLNPDSSFRLIGVMKDGNCQVLPVTANEIIQMRYLVAYFEGTLKKEEPLTIFDLAFYLIEGFTRND